MWKPITRKLFCQRWDGRTNWCKTSLVVVTRKRLEIRDKDGFFTAIPFTCPMFRNIVERLLWEKGF